MGFNESWWSSARSLQISLQLRRELLDAGIISQLRPPIITLAPKKLILTRRASEGSASEPSLARRVSMSKDAKLSCRGNSDLTPYRNRRAVPIQREPISEAVIREPVKVAIDFLDTSAVIKQYVKEGDRHGLGASTALRPGWVAGVELASASEPPGREATDLVASPSGRRPQAPVSLRCNLLLNNARMGLSSAMREMGCEILKKTTRAASGPGGIVPAAPCVAARVPSMGEGIRNED